MTYEELGRQTGELVDKKQAGYGNAVDIVPKIMQILCPNGIPPEKYEDAELIMRILEKFVRILNGDPRSFGENPWDDAAGYCIIGKSREKGYNCDRCVYQVNREKCELCVNGSFFVPMSLKAHKAEG